MGSSDVHLRTGSQAGRSTRRPVRRPRPQWGGQVSPAHSETPDHTVAPVQTPARSAAATWAGELQASPLPRAGRRQRRAPRGEGAVLRGAQNAARSRRAARGQISRRLASPTRSWTARARAPAPRWSCLLPAGACGRQTE